MNFEPLNIDSLFIKGKILFINFTKLMVLRVVI